MAHHSRYKRVVADRIPLLDEKVFWRKWTNLINRFGKAGRKMSVDEYFREYVALASDFNHSVVPEWTRTYVRQAF